MQQFVDILLNGPARYTLAHHLNPWLTLGVVLGALVIEFGAVYGLVWLLIQAGQQVRPCIAFVLRLFGVSKRVVPYVFLQLTFPANTVKSAYATEQLHILLSNIAQYETWWEWLAGRTQPYSIELVATKNEGIRYVIMIPKEEREVVKRTLLSFLPGLKIGEIEDYVPAVQSLVTVVELVLGNDFVLPLASHKILKEHDPIAYLTGAMRNLARDELVAFQIVAAPVLPNTHHNVLRRVRMMEHRIALKKQLASVISAERINIGAILLRIVLAPAWAFALGAKLIAVVFDALVYNELPKSGAGEWRRPGDPYETELSESIKAKLDQQLFEVSMRILVATPDANSRIHSIIASFAPFASSYQAIRARPHIPYVSSHARYFERFQKRLLSPHSVSQQTILSSAELADLYHFPNTDVTKTEDLIKSRSRDLPTPLSFKSETTNLDVIVGVNEFGGQASPVGMTLEQRQRHAYILGKTGTGKTTLLMSSVYQDMVSGKGLAVLDPHGDMFRELLSLVPEDRRDDVVVFDPADRAFPLGLNILDPGIRFENEDDKQEWITSMVLSVFKKLADEEFWGPRMEHILRNTTMTALTQPHPSLFTLQRLLTDKKYQKEVAATLKDPVLKQFWDKELRLLGHMQLASVVAPLTHRLGHFMTTKSSRHILLQEKSTLRIEDIIDEGKILLVNLSKGDIGEDQSFFFGTILTSLIWMAAYQRTKIPENRRRDFFVYVDEFQNFATPSFSEIVSEGRKFHISLVVSHQHSAQIEDESILKIVAGNASTIICLKASPEDEDFILPYMAPEVERGDIVNLAPHHFYMKVTGEVSEDAFSGETVPLGFEGTDETRKAVVASSRKRYGVAKKEVEHYLELLFSSDRQGQQNNGSNKRQASDKLLDVE